MAIYMHTYNMNNLKGTHYYIPYMTYIWFYYYNELQNTVTLVSKKPSYHVITGEFSSRPHQRTKRPYTLSCQRWKISWRTFMATAQIDLLHEMELITSCTNIIPQLFNFRS